MADEKTSPPPAPVNQDKTAGNPPSSPQNQEITRGVPVSPINVRITNSKGGKLNTPPKR